jgi:hypothetical protein
MAEAPLVEENRILRAQPKGKRLQLTDDQRRRKTRWRAFLKAHWESTAAAES